MATDRTWRAPINMDAHTAAWMILRGGEDKTDYLDGLTHGMHHADPSREGLAYSKGYEIGREARDKAEEYRGIQSANGKLGGRPSQKTAALPPVNHRLSDGEATPNLTCYGLGIKDPLPGARSTKGKSAARKPVDRGNYPPELEEAIYTWRALLNDLRAMEDEFASDQRFIATMVGTKEKTWTAWQKHLATTVQGQPVTNADVLFAVKAWANQKRDMAKNKVSLIGPMLPSMINNDDFIDPLVASVKRRIKAEEEKAQEPPPEAPQAAEPPFVPPTPAQVAAAIAKDREGDLPPFIRVAPQREAS